MSEWKPLSIVLGLGTPLATNVPKGTLETELRLLEQYRDEIDKLKDEFAQLDANEQRRSQNLMNQKLQIFARQIQRVQTDFPDADEGKYYEAAYYTLQAYLKIFTSGAMRRFSQNSGVALGIASGLIANSQEKKNMMEAVSILDTALSIHDYPGARFFKAALFSDLGQKAQALAELNYIIAHFPDDDVYIEARQMKDELEVQGGFAPVGSVGGGTSGGFIGKFGMSSGDKNQTLPVVSLALGVLGIILICCYGGIPFGIGALVTGFLGFQNANNAPDVYGGTGLAIGGMVTGGLSLVITLAVVFVALTAR